MTMEQIDRQFVSEYEEIYLKLGYYPRQIVIPRLENEITYARPAAQVIGGK